MKKKLLLIAIFFSIILLVGCTEKEPTEIQKEPSIVEIQNNISDVYNKVSSGCVGIYAASSTKASTGSGVVYKEENGLYYVVTNCHVIENTTTVRIFLGGSKYYQGSVVGYDAKNDIAVITFSLDLFGGPDIYVNDFFNYDEEIVIPGQTAIAIGCPLGLENFNSITTGIVSRIENGLIQTDTAINPGNSGGGLFNLAGRLIGINTEKEIYTSGLDSNGNVISIPVEGIGYAISLDVVKKCIEDIEANGGEITRPTLGLTISVVNRYLNDQSPYLDYMPNSLDEALVVSDITSTGVAAKAGVKLYDVIISVDDVEVTTLNDLSNILNLKLIGQTLKLKVYRASATTKEVTITITL